MAAKYQGDVCELGERQLTFDANRSETSQMITIEIDLTDPQDLLEKLELIDLTDEETDTLIERAMQLNKQLRKLEKQNITKEFRSFTVSAPSFQRRTKLPHHGLLVPGSPRLSYRDHSNFKANSLARLQSSNANSGLSRITSSAHRLQLNSYSYHSARPMRLTGIQSESKEAPQASHFGNSMDDY